MSSQKVANNPLGSYPVLVDITSDGSQIQNVRNVSTIVYIDNVSGTVKYYGFASPGTPTNLPYWRIIQELTVGTVTSYLYADGTLNYTSIWDNRASLSYS